MTNKNAQLPPKVGHILRLAEIIREVDGNHSLGAAALAEAILSHPGSRWARPAPAPAGEVAELVVVLCEAAMEASAQGRHEAFAQFHRAADLLERQP